MAQCEYTNCEYQAIRDYKYCQSHIEYQKPLYTITNVKTCQLCNKSLLNTIFYKNYKILQCGCIFHKKCIYKNLEQNIRNPCTCPICKKYCYIPDLILTNYQISTMLFYKSLEYRICFRNELKLHDIPYSSIHSLTCDKFIKSIRNSCLIHVHTKTQKHVNKMIAYHTNAFNYALPSYIEMFIEKNEV